MIGIKFGVNAVINVVMILRLGILGVLVSLPSKAERSPIVIEPFGHHCVSVNEFH